MKKLTIIFITALIVGIFFSCEEEKGPVIKPESNITLDSVAIKINELTPEKANSIFATLIWTPAKYNVSVLQSFRVEVDTVGNNFEDPATVLNTEDDTVDISVFNFNKALTSGLGFPANKECTVELRVGSVLGEGNPQIFYTEPVEITVTTYRPPFEPEELFVHGTDGIMGSLLPVKSNGEVVSGMYEGYIYIPQGGDAIQFGNKTGETIYGNDSPDAADTDVDLNSSIVKDEGAIPVDSGYYQVTVNTYDLAYDLYETTWGVIGSAIDPYDWSEDIDMAYHPDKDIWTVVVEAKDAEFKFRPNDLWNPLNYGDNEGDGIPEEYGANIPIGAGTKKITLDLSKYPYSYSIEDAK